MILPYGCDVIPQEVESLLDFLYVAVAAPCPHRLGVKLCLLGYITHRTIYIRVSLNITQILMFFKWKSNMLTAQG
jgi:hypothetical protein